MSILPYDAWALARLMADLPVEAAELAAVSEAFRSLADRLAAVPPDRRPDILDYALLLRPDRDAINRAMADAVPTGPPPAPDAAAADGAPPNVAKPRTTVRLTRADTIAPKAVEWLWRNRIPRGMLSLFSGDPKLGKSYLMFAMAAAVSRGVALPGDDPPKGPGSVIIMSAEDDPARTIIPRLIAAGADLSRVHILESVIISEGVEAPPSLRADMLAIEDAARRLPDLQLIIIDPVSAYLDGVDDHKNAQVRGVLSPLKALAERLNVATVLVSHHAKSGGTNGKHRVIGSIAYVGACRANWMCVRDKDDPTGRRVLLLDNGCNLAPTQPGLVYVIEDRGDGPRVEWIDGTIEKDADTVLREIAEAQAETGDPTRAAIRRECEEWLRETLAAVPKGVKEVFRLGSEAGYSQDQLKRAKVAIGARSEKEGFGDGWVWSLRQAPSGAPGDDEDAHFGSKGADTMSLRPSHSSCALRGQTAPSGSPRAHEAAHFGSKGARPNEPALFARFVRSSRPGRLADGQGSHRPGSRRDRLTWPAAEADGEPAGMALPVP